MYKSFLIKYAEIAIKGKNRYLFEDALVNNIRYQLKNVEGEFKVRKENGRIYVETEGEYDYDEAVTALQRVFGIVGIETAFPVLYTHLVKPGVISLQRLIQLLAENPRRRFDIPCGNDYTVWDLSKEFTVDPKDFLSMGKATPFTGWKLFGECVLTVCDNRIVYRKQEDTHG